LTNNSLPLIISCGIFRKEIEKLKQQKQLDNQVVFLDAGLHVVYAELEKEIKAELEKHKKCAPNGIVVVYGDMCHPRIKRVIKQYNKTVKIDALNCIDCLLGGHKQLLRIDPKCDHFYLSPGWMPSNLKRNKYFKEIFNWKVNGIKEHFEHLKGLIIVDSLDHIDELRSEIEEFSYHTGLEVKKVKLVGLDGLKAVIEEASKKLEN
jgi:hypothetical protein